MRPPIKHIALFLATIFLETHLLWKLDWSPYSPSETLVLILARPFQDLHTPFALVRFYRQTTGRRPYQAPLIQPDGEVVPHSYGVHLHPGYSMEAHKLFVGAGDLQRQIAFEYRHELGYRAEGLDEAMLRAVRADVGVDRVEMGCMVGGADPDPIEGDYDEVQRKFDVAMLLEELLGPEWEDELPSCPGLFADLRGIGAG
jgi:hypothetical protein